MSRSLTFILVVLVGAAAAVGLVSLTRASAPSGSPAPPAPASEAQIDYRLNELARFEQELRRKVAAATAPVPSRQAARPVVVRGPSATVVSRSQAEHEDEAYDDDEGDEGEGRDD